MKYNRAASYVLVNDVDASDTINWNDGAGFESIGTMTSAFTGNFDGQGHKVTGLYIYRPDKECVGLFGATLNSTVKNTEMEDVNITGRNYVGSLVGAQSQSSSISNSQVSGNITGFYNEVYFSSNHIGGLVGYSRGNTRIINSKSFVNVKGTKNIGGLVGYAIDGTIEECSSISNVKGDTFVGGLAGFSYYIKIDNSYSCGKVDGVAGVGGLVGVQRHTSPTSCAVEDSYSSCDVKGQSQVGGLIGSSQWASVIESYSTGTVQGNDTDTGGLVGRIENGNIKLSYSTGNVYGIDNVGGLVGVQINSYLNDSYFTGNVTGTGENSGGFVGASFNSDINCVCSEGNVFGNNYAGGLIGRAENLDLNNSYSLCDVIGIDYVGGLIGSQESHGGHTVNSYSNGYVSSACSKVGGLIGNMWYGAVTNSYWDINTSNQTSSVLGIGRTTSEMTYPHASNTYVNWDFDNIWSINPDINDGYPYLQFTYQDTVSMPTDLSYDKGNFYVNWSWNSGVNTDSFNVSVNGIWHNATTHHYFNDTPLDPHGTSSIVVYAFNKSKNTLSRPISSNVQLDNNPVTITGLSSIEVTEGEVVYVNADSDDLDGDVPLFNCSRKDLFRNFDNKTGEGSWVTGHNDAGVYSVIFDVNDDYGSTDSQTISIIVKEISEEPELIFSITDNIDKTSPGSELIYEITLQNTGNIELTNVSIINVLPSKLTFVSAPDCEFNSSTNCVSMDIGILSPDETVTFFVTTKATACGTITNSATMYCEQHESVCCYDLTEVVDNEAIPEFSTMVLPMLTIIGIAFVFSRKKE